jgi:hypothetical protein
MERILKIRGVSGVGKSTVGKLLTKYFKRGITIVIDDIRCMVNSVAWTNNKEYLEAIEATRALMLVYLKYKYAPIVIIDTFGNGTIKMITDHLPVGTNYKIITLIASETMIAERVASRNKEFIFFENESSNDSPSTDEKLKNNFQIDTTNMTATEVFEKVIQI